MGVHGVDTMPIPAESPTWPRAGELADRRTERDVLDRLVEAVRTGDSRALVVHGEPGAGKTALLEYLAGRASGCRVVRAAGVESEMELAFAGLHQVCTPLLDRLEALAAPQAEALRVTFGMSSGPTPDPFFVGLAALGLLAESAGERPVVCLVDDAQWLDRASLGVLAFVARRLVAESVALVFGARAPARELERLTELAVGGLPHTDALILLDSVLLGPIDARVRDQIVAETHGNPLALLELPRGLTAAELAGGFGLPGALPGAVQLPGLVEETFRRRMGVLPAQTRRLLLLAAADPTGDSALVWRAADRLDIPAAAATPAAADGLADFGARVMFRHPLVRSAAYRAAPLEDRRDVHRALAEATDAQADPDRRAWHRAQAAPGPDEDVAAELERSASRVRARGGPAAAAADFRRSWFDGARRSGWCYRVSRGVSRARIRQSTAGPASSPSTRQAAAPRRRPARPGLKDRDWQAAERIAAHGAALARGGGIPRAGQTRSPRTPGGPCWSCTTAAEPTPAHRRMLLTAHWPTIYCWYSCTRSSWGGSGSPGLVAEQGPHDAGQDGLLSR